MYCNWWFVLSWVVKEQPAFCMFISQHTGCTEVNETPQEYKHPGICLEYEMCIFIAAFQIETVYFGSVRSVFGI